MAFTRPEERYERLRHAHPALFRDSGETPIRILQDPIEVAKAAQLSLARVRNLGLPDEAATLGVVLEDQYVIIVRDPVQFRDGTYGSYLRIIEKPIGIPGVAILPICSGQIVLCRIFRHAPRSEQLEIPRGFGEPGRLPEENARSELLEEIGASEVTLGSLGLVHADTGLLTSPTELFLARVSSYTGPADAEITCVREFPLNSVMRMIDAGEITDSFTIAAVYRAQLRGLV